MPLTRFQAEVLGALADGRGRDSYLAGGAALHLCAGGERYSADLDFFHSTANAANDAFDRDANSLRLGGGEIVIDAQFPGFVKARVSDGSDTPRHFRAMVSDTDLFIATNLQREPGALFCDTRTGAFFLPHTPDDWAHAREHRGALGGIVPQLADVSLASLGAHE